MLMPSTSADFSPFSFHHPSQVGAIKRLPTILQVGQAPLMAQPNFNSGIFILSCLLHKRKEIEAITYWDIET